jgi:hypothetical protein
MSDINYDLLRGGAGGDPPDGTYTAYLAVAKLLDLSGGSKLVTEWQTSGATPYYWSTWHGFSPNRMNVTQEFLDGLGVDRATITDDAALEAALADVQGLSYHVRTAAWSGGINTFVDEVAVPAGARQAALDDDLGTDTSDLPVAAAVVADDDDVPF